MTVSLFLLQRPRMALTISSQLKRFAGAFSHYMDFINNGVHHNKQLPIE